MLAVLLLLAFSTSFAQNLSCSTGYTQAVYKGGAVFCWKLYATLKTHSQAEVQCINDGGSLIRIIDSTMNGIIANISRSRETIHIGVRCYSSTVCVYDNGETIKNVNSYFYGGMANPAVGECVIMDADHQGPFYGKWLSVACDATSSFVCQAEQIVNFTTNNNASSCGYPYHINAPAIVRNCNIAKIFQITSPNYPSNYYDNENCAYFIYNGPFTIIFDDFVTEGPDTLQIYSTSSTRTSNLIFTNRYSGTLGSFNVSISTSSAVLIFASDSSVNYRGFYARIAN